MIFLSFDSVLETSHCNNNNNAVHASNEDQKNVYIFADEKKTKQLIIIRLRLLYLFKAYVKL